MWIIKYLFVAVSNTHTCMLVRIVSKDKSLPFLFPVPVFVFFVFFWGGGVVGSIRSIWHLYLCCRTNRWRNGAVFAFSRQCKTCSMFPLAVISQSYLRPYNCFIGTDWTDGLYKCSLDQIMSADWAGFGVTVICWVITHCCGSIGFIVLVKSDFILSGLLIAWI